MKKNVFVTGLPGYGKTTLIKEILGELKIKAKGFFTEEIRTGGERIGFKIVTLSGKTGILAEKGFRSPYKVSKYGVLLQDLEEIGVKEIEEGLKGGCLILVDELGKMELFSEKFREVISRALDSKNKVLGTMMLKSNPFADKIKQRADTKIFYLTRQNFEKTKNQIKELIK